MSLTRQLLHVILFGLMLMAVPQWALARDVVVAVAANFTAPAKEIAQAFEVKSGHHIILSFGPSGAFYSQMKQGAPFEIFLSADAERPAALETEGFGVKDTRFTYAYGALVLWSAKPGFVDDKGAVLARGQFTHIAIANPASAPYGQAAVETMKALNLYERLAPKIVMGGSIAQAYSYVDSGAAELGFVALSQVTPLTKGSVWPVPKSAYRPIAQQAILLKTGKDNPAARAFLTFLKGPQAVKIIKTYGYEIR
ncbi:MAG: molybdate ABC transporter substrate-binding protein [Asticcacaulis sp.]